MSKLEEGNEFLHVIPPHKTGQTTSSISAHLRGLYPWHPAVFKNDFGPHGQISLFEIERIYNWQVFPRKTEQINSFHVPSKCVWKVWALAVVLDMRVLSETASVICHEMLGEWLVFVLNPMQFQCKLLWLDLGPGSQCDWHYFARESNELEIPSLSQLWYSLPM